MYSSLEQDILSVLPNAGHLSTAEIHRKLSNTTLDGPVSTRTILRAMERLLEASLVESQKQGVSLTWRKRAGANGIRLGAMMTHDEALALQTLKRFSARQIPALVAESLSGMFDVARKRLENAGDEYSRRYLKWEDKVDVVNGGFTLRCPTIGSQLFSEVSQALFHERKLEIIYRPRTNADNGTAKTILPLGLVEMGGLVYLVAGMDRHENPAMYRLDRLSRATMLDEAFSYPRTFSLADYVRQQRQFDFMVEGVIRLKLRFSNGAGDHLLETPLSEDQQAERSGDFLEVSCSVALSQRLRWWLRAFGPNVEVVEPASLRAEFAREAKMLTAIYGKRETASIA
jgi:predicted DNA-binding transcriptional regulator YafY